MTSTSSPARAAPTKRSSECIVHRPPLMYVHVHVEHAAAGADAAPAAFARWVNATSAAECCTACAGTPTCKSWEWAKGRVSQKNHAGNCHLKAAPGPFQKNGTYIYLRDQQKPAGTSAPAAAAASAPAGPAGPGRLAEHRLVPDRWCACSPLGSACLLAGSASLTPCCCALPACRPGPKAGRELPAAQRRRPDA